MILAIDQGTTGTTCIVFDEEGRPAGRAYSEFEQHFPRPGWVEHDAAEIWDVTRQVAGRGARRSRGRRRRPAARSASQTSARPSLPGTRRAASRCIGRWSGRTGARRSAARSCARTGREELVRERTGLVLDPYFSGTKIEWLLRERRGDADGGLRDDRLLARLQAHRRARHRLHERLTDDALRHPPPRVGRGALLDSRRRRRLACRGRSRPASVFGTTSEFGGEVPVAGIAGDQQAALFGQACQRPGEAKNTYGTGSFVLLHAGAEAPAPATGLLTTVACGGRRRPRLRARGVDLRHRRRGAVAARRARGDRARPPRRRRSPPRWRPTTASTSCRP